MYSSKMKRVLCGTFLNRNAIINLQFHVYSIEYTHLCKSRTPRASIRAQVPLWKKHFEFENSFLENFTRMFDEVEVVFVGKMQRTRWRCSVISKQRTRRTNSLTFKEYARSVVSKRKSASSSRIESRTSSGREKWSNEEKSRIGPTSESSTRRDRGNEQQKYPSLRRFRGKKGDTIQRAGCFMKFSQRELALREGPRGSRLCLSSATRRFEPSNARDDVFAIRGHRRFQVGPRLS